MIPVPLAQQPLAPGARLVSGALLNRIAAAIQARTPLNAGQSTAQGYRGAAQKGGSTPRKMQAPQSFQADRVYVLPQATLKRFADDLKARTPSDEGVRDKPELQADAVGLRGLLRTLEWISPDSFEAANPAGFRLPLDKPRLGDMSVELELKQMFANMCYQNVNLDTQEYITKTTTVSIYDNGTIIETVTAAGNIQTWQFDAAPSDCATLVYTSDRVDDFSYGSLVGDPVITYETHPCSEARDAAVAALDASTPSSPTYDFTWPQAEWRAATAGGWTPYPLGNIGCFTDLGSAIGRAWASYYRWRVNNTGECHIKLFWERRLQSDDSVLESGSLNIGRGQTSDWLEPPAATADPAAQCYVTLASIQLGPYR